MSPNVHFCASEVWEKDLMEKSGLQLEYALSLDTLLFQSRNTHPIFVLCITKVTTVFFPRTNICNMAFLKGWYLSTFSPTANVESLRELYCSCHTWLRMCSRQGTQTRLSLQEMQGCRASFRDSVVQRVQRHRREFAHCPRSIRWCKIIFKSTYIEYGWLHLRQHNIKILTNLQPLASCIYILRICSRCPCREDNSVLELQELNGLLIIVSDYVKLAGRWQANSLTEKDPTHEEQRSTLNVLRWGGQTRGSLGVKETWVPILPPMLTAMILGRSLHPSGSCHLSWRSGSEGASSRDCKIHLIDWEVR